MYKFLANDLKSLERNIQNIREEIKEVGKRMGESCQQGAETYHDNFAYEEGERLMKMWGARINELSAIQRQAKICEPDEKLFIVCFGRRIIVQNLDTNQIATYRIGSYLTFHENDEPGITTISYTSPLAELLMGATIDNIREGEIGDGLKRFKIIMVW